MSVGDIRIYRGAVTDYWGWEVSMDNSEMGRKVGGWASSRDAAYSDAMNVLRLDGEPDLAEDEFTTRSLAAYNVESMARDLTACRSELASIAILMQERGRLPDLGGDNYSLVAGAVTEYMLAMELAVIALNEDRNDLLIQIGNLNNLLACDDDCYHAPMCVRWEHGDEPNDPSIA
ncbi:MAG TPA: hypothetical protein PLT40_17230 [Ilumatobacteraceae bacterium]|nr:hypothetical protein [Ilumatobacteraceae bacterium]